MSGTRRRDEVAVESHSWSTEALPMRSSGIRRINNAVRGLDMAFVENVLNPPDDSVGGPFELCAATRDDWNRYVRSEEQMMGSRRMAWWDGRVFIVDLAASLHEDLVGGIKEAITEATGTGRTHLARHGAAYIGNCPMLPDDVNDLLALLEPDASFGPVQGLPGVVRPQGFSWRMFHTLKVEIGVAQSWGAHVPQQAQAGHQGQVRQQGQQGQAGSRRVVTLNEKADAWRQCPGVEYVLSVRISQGMSVREYRLDSIVDGQFEDPGMQHAPINNDTVVRFDARRLLGLPHGALLPVGFNDPVQFNLFDIVNPIIQRHQEDIAEEQAIQAMARAAAAAAGQPPYHRHRRH